MVEPASASQSPISSDPIALSFDDLRQACDMSISALKSTFGWPDADRRIEGIHRLRNVFQSTLALFAFHRVIFPTKDFWTTFFVALPTSAEFEDHYKECDVLLRFAALHGQFSAFEADMRAIVFALDPTACAGGTAQFDSVARWLLARVKSATPSADFIELLRLTRNTIHNNGVHRPTSGKNTSVSYGGTSYAFTVGQPIKFVNWPFVVLVGRGLLELFEAIARDPVVACLASV